MSNANSNTPATIKMAARLAKRKNATAGQVATESLTSTELRRQTRSTRC